MDFDPVLTDLTSNGLLYKDRFVSRGKEAFNFQFFKFGAPDESLTRAQDATLKIRMSSVIYVHTQRFYSELFAFFNTFQRLMAGGSGGGGGHHQAEPPSPAKTTVPFQEKMRGARVRVDLEAGSPLLILPMSSFATQAGFIF